MYDTLLLQRFFFNLNVIVFWCYDKDTLLNIIFNYKKWPSFELI